MATVYFFDVSFLASYSLASLESTPQSTRSLPPLSWWCAGEVAQWTSAVALRDAWAATASYTVACPPLNETSTSQIADRSSYISFNDDDDKAESSCDGSAAKAATSAAQSPPLYQLVSFPTPATIQNRYFSATLALRVGCAASTRVTGQPLPAATRDATLALLQALLRNSVEDPADRYGGVLVVDVRQDPAEVPWHMFVRGGACLARVVMVFLGVEENVDELEAAATQQHNDPTETLLFSRGEKNKTRRDVEVWNHGVVDNAHAAHGTSHLDSTRVSSWKERWQYFAVENGYECVFHRPAASSCAGASAADALEVVTAASGRRGVLEAPLHGSNRLYQILCNTLWPADVRTEIKNSKSASATGLKGRKHLSNSFIVVGNNARVAELIFHKTMAEGSSRTRRQLRFFTKLVHTHSKCGGSGTNGVSQDTAGEQEDASVALAAPSCLAQESTSQPTLVLVNKYYAAVAQPQLVQTAYFSPQMQDMLERFWEQHFAGDGATQPPCADAPTIVLWPPSPSSFSPSALQFAATATNDQDSNKADEELDVRTAYPPLETVLDFLRHHGCQEVVVITSADSISTDSACHLRSAVSRRSRARHSRLVLSPYELRVCAERNVEVVDLGEPPAAQTLAAQDAPPVPVLRDKDDVCATRAADRLDEILHCVQWKRSQPLLGGCVASGPASAARCAAPPTNSCLLAAYGADAFEEEEWMCNLVGVLRRGLPTVEERETAMCDSEVVAVAAAAPTIATCMFATTTPASASNLRCPLFPVTMENSYFQAEVQLHLRGGLWAHYCAASPPLTSSLSADSQGILQSDALGSFDGYVIATNLRVLQEAAAAAVSGSQAASSERAAELARVLPALMRKEAEWISTQKIPEASACADEVADTPLTMLYVTDVKASDEARIALVDACLCAIAQAHHPTADEDGELLGMPLEVVFASELSDNLSVPSTTSAWDVSVDGLQRVREAFEQQLWPHRLTCEDRMGGHAIPRSPSSVAAGSATAKHEQREPATRTDRPNAEKATVTEKKETSSSHSISTADPCKPEEAWVAPTIGCALPPDYLIDPETLQSVRLGYAANFRAGATTATRLDNDASKRPLLSAEGTPALAEINVGFDTDSVASSALQPASSARFCATETELMVWMDKMKMYGHRLGAAQRKEQAAALALALEELL